MTTEPEPDDEPMTIEEYAVDLVCSGAMSVAEDDMNEENAIDDADHPAAVALAYRIIKAIRANPDVVLELAASQPEETP